MTPISRAITALAFGTALVPALALAQTVGVNASAKATVAPAADVRVQTAATATTTALTPAAVKVKERADKEIDRRIEALNTLNARIQSMIRVSDSFKQALASNTQNQVQVLQSLKAKIDADTDLATLKADVQSIAESYRVYRLVLPQGHISAMADRIATITAMLQGIGTKLQARIETAAAAGNDTTAATKALADLGTKIASAQTQAQAAVTLILPLKPDQGDKATMQSNLAALKAAQKDLQTAQQDVVAARKDIAAIVGFLASVKVQAAASATTTATTTSR